MYFNNKVYDVLKWIVLIALPALAAAYGSLAATWNLPYAAEVVQTINILTVLLGAMIGISTASYNKDKTEGGEDHEN